MTKSNFFKRLLPFILAFVLVLPTVVFAAPQDDANGGSNDGVTWEKVDNVDLEGLKPAHKAEGETLEKEDIVAGNVRVSIIVDGKSTIGAGFDTQGIGTNSSAISYRNEVLAKQNALSQKISKEALGGAELDVVWNITLAANIISANVPSTKIEAIKNVDGVVDVVIENQYEPASTVEANDPNMSNASDMTGAQKVWANGYTGAGSKLAIIDTGLDVDHVMFNADAFDYAIEQTGKTVDLLEEADITAVLTQLNINRKISNATAEDLYLTSKIPYAANYVDGDYDVTHVNDTQGEHGSHVAGIAAGNRFVKVGDEFKNSLEEVFTQGEAPDAQVMVMKVFGKGGGAYDSDYFVAIEDAIILGADSVNLSLGSGSAGFSFDSTYNDILEEMKESSTVVVMSAGNNSYWSEDTFAGYNYSEDAKFHTGGSPGSFRNSLGVASVDNDGFTGSFLKSGDQMIFYTESTDYNNAPITSIGGEHEFVYIDAIGSNDEFAAVADKLAGKIGICNRGSSSFYEKANAAIGNGAIATIIANNQPGTINMNLTGYTYTAPAISITQADANYLKATATSSEKVDVNGTEMTVYYGTITVADGVSAVNYGSEYYTMSSFSSWGVPESLILKPEITAPGGNIYSVFGAALNASRQPIGGHDQFENMSGTSMAAPQITGLAAVLKQYIRENDLVAKTGLTERQLTNSLLMSTAEPLLDANTEYYYPVIQQGAGLVDLDAAVNAETYIMMDESATASASDGKIKVELGDDPDRKGSYSATFTVNNFSEDEKTVYLDADFFTQDVFAYYTFDAAGNPVYNEDGSPVISYYRDTWAAPLDYEIRWTADGSVINGIYDFDGDGSLGNSDVQALLDFVVGIRESIENENLADYDNDGDIDTYDAYLASTFVEIPANGSVTITAEINILDADDYDDNGTYIEGYLFATEAEMADGAIGVTHSIPVVGYYGSWSEFGSTDKGSYIEYAYGLEQRAPYLAYQLGESAVNTESFLIQYAGDTSNYYLGGNPYDTDAEYMPERNAINSTTTVSSFRYTLIRNAAGRLFTVTDADGNEVYNSVFGQAYSAYYYPNGAEWRNTSASAMLGYRPSTFAEGTALNLNMTFAPEYYRNSDGTIAWDELHENATVSMPVVIDNTAPEILNVETVKDEEGKVTTLNVTVKDNEYVAAVGVYSEADAQIAFEGSIADAEKGAETTYTFDLTNNTENHIYVFAGDYAANESTYKINFNEEELTGDYEVTLTAASTRILAGNTTKVTASVLPWGVDDSVTFASSDEAIATVDETGVVTGVAAGTVTITATSTVDTEASGSVDIEVFTIPMTALGVLQNESGTPLLFTYDLENGEDYVAEGEVGADLTAAAWNWNVDDAQYFYQQDSEGYISKIDINTLETVEKSAAATGFGAPMEDIDFPYVVNQSNETSEVFGVYSGYLLMSDNIMDNTFTSGYNLATYLRRYTRASQFVAIAWGGKFAVEDDPSTEDEDETSTGDEFLALDDKGYIWALDYSTTGDLSLGMIPSNLSISTASIGDTTGNSLVLGNDGELYLAHFDGNTSEIYQLAYNTTSGSFDATRICDVGDDVWPAALLAVAENESGDEGGAAREITASPIPAEAIENVAYFTAEDFEEITADGSLNGVVEVTPSVEIEKLTKDAPVETQAAGIYEEITIAITADANESEDLIHNGLYEVSWDPEVVEFLGGHSDTEFISNISGEDNIRFGYVDKAGLAPNDTVMELTFKYRRDNLEETAIDIKTLDNGCENPGTAEKFIIKGNGFIESGNGVTGVAVDPAEITVAVDATEQIAPVITPADAMIQDVTYASADESIATVDENGVVKGVKIGKTTVTVTTVDGGYTAEVAVTVLFKDVTDSSKYYFTPVYWAADKGITKGYSDGTFGVGKGATRQEFILFVYRLAGQPDVDISNINTRFSDVSKLSDTFKKAIAWGANEGIIKGYSDGTFGVGKPVVRKDAMIMIYRFAGKPAPTQAGIDKANSFSDVKGKYKETTDTFKSIAWAAENGITKGYSSGQYKGQFGCNLDCLREQLITFLYRMDNLN